MRTAKPSNILGTAKITYSDGLFQFKNLVQHDDFKNDIQPTQWRIYDIEKANNFKPHPDSEALKRELRGKYGELWFTDKSPIFEAVTTGEIALLKHQGGNHKAKVEISYEP